METHDTAIYPENHVLDADVDALVHDQPLAHFSLTGLDKLVGGVRNRLIILSGEPSAGKTSLALQLADDLASNGFGVLYLSLEMARSQLIGKSLSRIAAGKLPLADIGNPLKQDCLQAAVDQYRTTIAPRIYIIERALTPVELSICASQAVSMHGPRVAVIVDYLQIMPVAPDRQLDERSAVKHVVSGLRSIVNGCHVPLIAISSINRTSYAKPNAGLDALAESSAIEYGADCVLHLSVAGQGEERKLNMRKPMRPIVLTAIKNRYGAPGEVKLIYDACSARFLPAAVGVPDAQLQI